ncbi:HK97 family phage prohead protease [Mesorhizobium silamurunense]|uniref:HK97 family phage prohead protease n=1 Tax=Mesorhizobium silamurunense TaxID=499528 RepID=UPI001784CB90|nr:HK97 family phage prohead protease [Mesorhizobium silamurunense]
MARFKKVSADEARATRANIVKDVGGKSVVFKGATFKAPPSWNAEKRNARFTMTSEAVDRYGDIVVQNGLDTTRFLENPQGLLFHNSRAWPAGMWSDVVKNLTGRPKRTEGTFNFLPEGTDEDADRAARHVAVGSLRTVSIGFNPDWDQIELILDDEEDWITGLKFNASELLECSLVPIPAQPDALAKGVDGDWKLAREVIEEIIDGWAKSPDGILIPKSVHERTYRTIVQKIGEDAIAPAGNSAFIIDKALAPSARKFVPVADMELKASTDAEAEKFVGAKVMFDPAHAENKDCPHCAVIGRGVGEVIASWIVDEGEFKGVHALAVEFLTDAWSGMFRGIKAERFLLVSKAEDKMPEPDDNPECADDADKTASEEEAVEAKGAELLTDDVLDAFAALVKDGDVVVLRDGDEMCLALERDGERIDELELPLDMTIKQINETSQSICDRVNKAKESAKEKELGGLSVSIEVDTKDATEKVGALEAMVDRLTSKMAKIFGRFTETDPAAPTPPEPPSDESVAAAKAAAAAARARLTEKGLLAA